MYEPSDLGIKFLMILICTFLYFVLQLSTKRKSFHRLKTTRFVRETMIFDLKI